MSEEQLAEILKLYGINQFATPYGNGHINDTYAVDDLIIQRINTHVFPNYKGLMQNILLITDFLRKKIIENGGDPLRETLTLVQTLDGRNYVEFPSGVYRVYKRIPDAVSYDSVSPGLLYEAARGFGTFQSMLADFPADQLVETIPNFHNTRSRFENLRAAVKADAVGRAEAVSDEIAFAYSHEKDVDVVLNAIADGRIPLRVTHNDTKLNNVLLDIHTGKAVCVLDLDTVMPGSLLYDYGDALRFGASTAAEDERDLNLVHFDLSNFEAFTKGFLEGIGGNITPCEQELLPFSIRLLTLECGMRFLTDYLEGDTYFKTSRRDQNLDRCRTQFKLVREIEGYEDQMKKLIEKIKFDLASSPSETVLHQNEKK
ncbi:MAG: phosphotransferase enzyme family protein [Eubacteriales bacterium]